MFLPTPHHPACHWGKDDLPPNPRMQKTVGDGDMSHSEGRSCSHGDRMEQQFQSPDRAPHVLDTVTDARLGILETALISLFSREKSDSSESLLHSIKVTQETSELNLKHLPFLLCGPMFSLERDNSCPQKLAWDTLVLCISQGMPVAKAAAATLKCLCLDPKPICFLLISGRGGSKE